MSNYPKNITRYEAQKMYPDSYLVLEILNVPATSSRDVEIGDLVFAGDSIEEREIFFDGYEPREGCLGLICKGIHLEMREAREEWVIDW